MHTGTGRVVELILSGEIRHAHVSCQEKLIPAPGQYLLAGSPDAILPVPIFYTDSASQGFITPVPDSWSPGDVLSLRGPLGRGFSLPVPARRVGLVAFDGSPVELRGLVAPVLNRGAAVVLVCPGQAEGIPDEVEIQPLAGLEEIIAWADTLAMQVRRENLPVLLERLRAQHRIQAVREGQVLVRTDMPCGGIAECGVCAVATRSGWKMACKDGPVFDLGEF